MVWDGCRRQFLADSGQMLIINDRTKIARYERAGREGLDMNIWAGLVGFASSLHRSQVDDEAGTTRLGPSIGSKHAEATRDEAGKRGGTAGKRAEKRAQRARIRQRLGGGGRLDSRGARILAGKIGRGRETGKAIFSRGDGQMGAWTAAGGMHDGRQKSIFSAGGPGASCDTWKAARRRKRQVREHRRGLGPCATAGVGSGLHHGPIWTGHSAHSGQGYGQRVVGRTAKWKIAKKCARKWWAVALRTPPGLVWGASGREVKVGFLIKFIKDLGTWWQQFDLTMTSLPRHGRGYDRPSFL